jgi:nitrogenase molybdenum-iron protein beta chain
MSDNFIYHGGCEFQGALRTAAEIGGLVPIVHSNAGCGVQGYLHDLYAGTAAANGGERIPATSVIERHVIFGGTSRLREQIKNTVSVFDGGAYIIINGCESAMVGDDSAAMAKEAREQGGNVISCDTAGFRAGPARGYERVMTDLLQNLKALGPINKPNAVYVNIFGIIPIEFPFYRGDMAEISRLLAGVGIKSNIFFSRDGLEQVKRAPHAVLSMVFSEWGKAPAQFLEEEYGTPVLRFDRLPIGFADTEAFLRTVLNKTSYDKEIADTFLQGEKERFEFFCESVIPYSVYSAHNKTAIGESLKIYDIAKFLSSFLSADIVNDEIDGLIKIEAENSPPVAKTYIGINGGLRLIEDYLSAAIHRGRLNRTSIISTIRSNTI